MSIFLFFQAFEISLHAVSTVLLHLLGNMPIDVKRECCRCMPDVGLHSLDVIAILQGDDGIGVPHIVEADGRQRSGNRHF